RAGGGRRPADVPARRRGQLREGAARAGRGGQPRRAGHPVPRDQRPEHAGGGAPVAGTPPESVVRALAPAPADGCVVVATERAETNLRWANNTLTTNGEMRSRRVAVLSVVNGTAGAAAAVLERSTVGRDDLEPLVRAAEQAARQAGPAQ